MLGKELQGTMKISIGLKNLLGFAPAIDVQRFEHNEGKEFGSGIHLLLAGMSKARLASPTSLMFSPHLIESRDLVNIVMAIHCRTAARVSGPLQSLLWRNDHGLDFFSARNASPITEGPLFWSVWGSRGHITLLVLRANATMKCHEKSWTVFTQKCYHCVLTNKSKPTGI